MYDTNVRILAKGLEYNDVVDADEPEDVQANQLQCTSDYSWAFNSKQMCSLRALMHKIGVK
jgi:hypothetical protein